MGHDQQISMVTAAEVRQWLASNLESVDLTTTSERMVIQQMVSELGDGASHHRAVAKEEITAYINSLAEEPATGSAAPAAEAATEADEDDNDFEEPASSKSKRKAKSASEAKPAKKGKLAAEPAAGTEDVEAPDEVPFNLSNNRKAGISDFKGTHYCNIREYYEKDGKQLPGKKGISLPQEQFLKLEQHAQELTEALTDKNDGFSVALSNKRKASISSFSNKWGVDIREWYEKDGEEKPGKKGIFLNPEQWHILAKGMNKLADAFP